MARSFTLHRLFVGIDIAARTCAVSWMRPNALPTRAITSKQTPPALPTERVSGSPSNPIPTPSSL